jgi:lectin family protein
MRSWINLSLFVGAAVQSGAAATIDLNSLNLVGTSQIVSGGVLRLTPNFDTDPSGDPPAGAAWTTTRFDVSGPFSVSFDFRMSDPTGHLDGDGSAGDGIAFLIQNGAAGDTAIGRGAGGMGFLGIYDSVAVMLDTYQNNYAYGDPNGNYIAVNTRGTDFNVPHHFCTNGELTTDPSQPLDLPGVTCTSNPGLGLTGLLPTLLDDGNVHNLTLLYIPGSLGISLDSMPVLTVPLNLADTLSLDGGTDAYLGFTAGTRFSYQNQDILDFSMVPVPEPGTGQQWLGALAVAGAMGLKRKLKRY